MKSVPRQPTRRVLREVPKTPPWGCVSAPSPAEVLTAAALGLPGTAGRFAGLLLLDHCPVIGEVTLNADAQQPGSGQQIQKLSPSVSLRRLNPLEPRSWEDAVRLALGLNRFPEQFPARDAFRAAHPCAVLQIDMSPVRTLSQAKLLMRHAGPCWLLALSLRVGAECEPFAQVMLDRQDARADIEFYAGFPHAYIAHMNSAWDHARRIVPGLARDPRLRLLTGLYRDFLREPEDSPAILKGWSLLEVMAAGETGGKKDMVRALCEHLGTSPNGIFLNGHYAEGEDLLDVAYRHRNCVAHDGWCYEANSRCSRQRWQGACRQARLIRVDLQFLLHGLLMDFLGLSTSWVVGPNGSHPEDRAGLYKATARDAEVQPHDFRLPARRWHFMSS